MKGILIHLKKLDWILILVSVFLICIGLLFIYSSSLRGGDFLNFNKQLIFFIFGFFLMILFSFYDWRNLRDNPRLILTLYILCLGSLVGLFFFAPEIREVRGWYKIGPITIDPIEFTKIVLIILLAKYFSIRHIEIYRLRHIILSGFYFLLPSILIFFQPDMGSILILAILWTGMLVVSGIKLRHFFILVFCFVLIFILGWNFFLQNYQKERILSFIQPQLTDPLKTGWSQTQSRIAIGSGGIWGKGLGKGSQTQLGFLPEPQTDFIFSVIAEETGLFGVMILLLLFSILIWRIIKIAILSPTNFPRLFASGFAILLVSEIFIHIGMNLGILPIIGIPLPFVSYSGSSLITNLITLGLIQNIKTNV